MSGSNNATAAGGALGADEQELSKVGLGYGIAIAVGILILVSTIMLASYVCIRVHSGGGNGRTSGSGSTAAPSRLAAAVSPSAAWIPRGVDQATLESYPRFIFASHLSLPHPEDTACVICLSDYKDGDDLRLLPDCRHAFHAHCIDSWMRRQATCPMCRTSPLPTPQATTPVSTPLSELIPLARHAS